MPARNSAEYCLSRFGRFGMYWRTMRIQNIYRVTRLALGVLAAVSLLVFATPAAMAQDSHRDGGNGGGYHQSQAGDQNRNNGGGGGFHQDQSGQHGHQWGETQPSGGQVYHPKPSYYYHPYKGPENRKYYTYQGSEFYLNLGTGIRVSL